MNKEYGSLIELYGQSVKYYKSSNPVETSSYFTDESKEESFFEILWFEKDVFMNNDNNDRKYIFIKYPNSEYFIEMDANTMVSCQGDMMRINGVNVWADEYEKDINFYNKKEFVLYSHGEDILISFENDKTIPKFNFLKLVAYKDNGNYYNKYLDKKTDNEQELINVFSKNKYLKLPYDVYDDVFVCYNSKLNFYVVFLCPKYYREYKKFECFLFNEVTIEKLNVISVEVLKDGGTTSIIVSEPNNNDEYLFYYPSKFLNKDSIPKFDGVDIIDIKDITERNNILSLLNKHINYF